MDESERLQEMKCVNEWEGKKGRRDSEYLIDPKCRSYTLNTLWN